MKTESNLPDLGILKPIPELFFTRTAGASVSAHHNIMPTERGPWRVLDTWIERGISFDRPFIITRFGLS